MQFFQFFSATKTCPNDLRSGWLEIGAKKFYRFLCQIFVLFELFQ